MSTVIHAGTVLGEVKLKVSDLTRSIAFYTKVIGLQVLEETSSTASLTADGSTPLVVLEHIPDAIIPPRRSVTGLYHFAILLPTRKALGLALRNLIQAGIHIGQADHLISEALYITDPDLNGIEIYADRPRDTWKQDAEGNYVMATNPIDWDGLLAEAGDESWTGLPAGTRIGHIHLHVGNLPDSQAFYCDLLGFEVVGNYANMGALFISAGGYHHHIGMNLWAGPGAAAAPANSTGLAYYTITVPDKTALQALISRLKDAGHIITVQNDAHTVKDPWGIEIRLLCTAS
ncbi:VOC family protein [Paenibacillus sp. y28]|uniref:VOC family protein n=1 Tax=Paenibacillus sp. y28 TaxID=3129110 RepID=UPI00301892BE